MTDSEISTVNFILRAYYELTNQPNEQLTFFHDTTALVGQGPLVV